MYYPQMYSQWALFLEAAGISPVSISARALTSVHKDVGGHLKSSFGDSNDSSISGGNFRFLSRDSSSCDNSEESVDFVDLLPALISRADEIVKERAV